MGKKLKRPVAKINRERQINLFNTPSSASPSVVKRPSNPSRATYFIDPDPNDLYLGNTPVREHLRSMGLGDGFVVREVLEEQDFGAIEASDAGGGRAAYAPRAMAGIVLYGLMHAVSSLRELERFARSDLGCMWVSGGIAPDHSVLGRFVQRHEAWLSEQLFEGIVETALKRTASTRERVAGDGTVIEAMSSRFGLLKREAAAQKLEALEGCTDEASRAKRERLETMCEKLDERRGANAGRGHQAANPREPDAALLKLKGSKSYRPAYVPVVLANEARVVVDAQIDSSHELKPLVKMLRRQSQRIDELLLDGGFLAREVLEYALNDELSVLIPPKAQPPQDEPDEGKRFAASAFRYDETQDLYICPAGERLRVERRYQGNERRDGYVRYGTQACHQCALEGAMHEGQAAYD